MALSLPFLAHPNIREKIRFLAFTFSHKPQVILGFLFLETILRHLCLSHIHPKLCAFFSIYFFLIFIKFGPTRATLLMIFNISDPLFFLHWYHLPTSIRFMFQRPFDSLLFSNPGNMLTFDWHTLESILLKM